MTDLEQRILNDLNRANKQRFHFSIYSQWSSFIFWRPVNWRDFTFIDLTFETNSYHWLEIDFALLGIKISFTIYKK